MAAPVARLLEHVGDAPVQPGLFARRQAEYDHFADERVREPVPLLGRRVVDGQAGVDRLAQQPFHGHLVDATDRR